MERKVVHCKREGYDVYVGRPSEWGNPFVLGRDGDRDMVVQKYRIWLLAQPELLAKLPTLAGRTLGCWCAPALCHGDVLAALAARSVADPERFEAFLASVREAQAVGR